MGIAARRKYEQLFTPEAVLPVLLDCYERVLNGATSSNGHGATKAMHDWISTSG
jgi:hypothetical protein